MKKDKKENNSPKIDTKLDVKLEKEIETELKFALKLLKSLILLPFVFFLFLINKRTFADVLHPLKIIWKFIRSAKFTFQIILLNILVFISQFFMSEKFFSNLIILPTDLISFRLHTLITSGFLHANFSHLFFNMLGILIFGRIVERKLGYIKTLYLYFGALLISNIITSLIYLFIIPSNVGGIGASGALMGLISTAMLLDPFYITHILIIPLPIIFVSWFYIFGDIQSVISGIDDGIGHFAHITGFISISLIYFLMNKKHKTHLIKGLKINLISAFIALLVYLFLRFFSFL